MKSGLFRSWISAADGSGIGLLALPSELQLDLRLRSRQRTSCWPLDAELDELTFQQQLALDPNAGLGFEKKQVDQKVDKKEAVGFAFQNLRKLRSWLVLQKSNWDAQGLKFEQRLARAFRQLGYVFQRDHSFE